MLPAAFTVSAIALGAIASHVRPSRDSVLGPLLFIGDAGEARRLLLTCATSIVGVLALVIGLTMVALQMAANRYSPRVLRSFIRDRKTQLVIATFVGAFTYNAAGLYTVGLEPGEYPRFAVTLGLCSLFVCIGALIFYIDRMVHAIQIDRVLAGIGIVTAHTIAAAPPGVGGNAGDGRSAAADGPPPGAAAVRAESSGYIEYIAPERIVVAAARCGATVLLEAGVGAHVVAHTPLAWVWPASADSPELHAAVDAAVHIGAERSRRQDVAVGLLQIVDIAVLSMHNFDYNTAVQCANELSILMCKLAHTPLGAQVYRDAAGTSRVIVPAPWFEDYLDIACGQILRRGATEPVALRAILDLLSDISIVADTDERRAAVAATVRDVLATARGGIKYPGELARLESVANIALSRLAATPQVAEYREAI